MQKYIVKFVELRHYEMTVEARDEGSAIECAKSGPEFPVWTGVELDGFKALPISGEVP
jgi:hypothetical protein